MMINVSDGEVITVILDSGARLVGVYRAYGVDRAMVGDWVIDPDKVMAYRFGEHPYRSGASRKGNP